MPRCDLVIGGMTVSMDLPFRDRAEAGHRLGAHLSTRDLTDPVVLGVPRGGVAVAAPVADALGAPLTVVVVRKVGAPSNKELGVGAVGPSGEPWLDERTLDSLGLQPADVSDEIASQREEARRRLSAYRGDEPGPSLQGRDAVVVDDGIATGGTVIAAARLLRTEGPKRLLLAVPVAPQEGVRRAEEVYDQVIALATPEPYFAVGQWYDDFHQVDDDEVTSYLRRGPGSRL